MLCVAKLFRKYTLVSLSYGVSPVCYVALLIEVVSLWLYILISDICYAIVMPSELDLIYLAVYQSDNWAVKHSSESLRFYVNKL